jgi:head-tail adaptor
VDPETRAFLDGFGREIRRHCDVVAEDLRSRIQTVAEGVAANAEAIVRFRADVEERFRASDALVRVALADVKRDIEALRLRR